MVYYKYAFISKVRKQVNGFTNRPESFVAKNDVIFVDLTNHPQKNEVQEDWFYDEESNTFNPDGEVEYVIIEEPPTQLDNIEAKQAEIEETQLVMMEAMADQYEQQLEQDLINMEAQATIYETLLEMGGIE